MTKTITVGDILNLIDSNRDSEEYVGIMNHNGNIECRAMVCSDIWDGIENRLINSMGAERSEIVIWLEDEVHEHT